MDPSDPSNPGDPSNLGDLADPSNLADLLALGRAAVLTGAGLSTESGIPDYRGPDGLRRRASPMTFSEFTASAEARRRYWARSHLGWPLIDSARPNAGHAAVAAWQAAGLLAGIITQNVDGLHQRAGAHSVIDLHGRLDTVVCLDCGRRSPRRDLHDRLSRANPGLDRGADASGRVNPDGDVELDGALVEAFRVADCLACRGVLKPDVVFFGESVPKDRVATALDLVGEARSLVVLGSSLSVLSGYRFVRSAHRLGKPIAIVNDGPTRGDAEATLRLSGRLGDTLTATTGALIRALAAVDR